MSTSRRTPGEAAGYPIRVAARMAGLTPATVRAWEKRYGAITPDRTATNRRLYSVEDVERLRLIAELSSEGYSPGAVAALGTAELRRMRGDGSQAAHAARKGEGLAVGARLAESCLDAASTMDSSRLYLTLMEALGGSDAPAAMDDIVARVLREIGARWERGTFSVAHEHAASAAIRQSLGWLLSVLQVSVPRRTDVPAVVVAAPAGDLHELGALMAAVTAAAGGWRVVYLGPNCPAPDIAVAVTESQAGAVALGMGGPVPRVALLRELRALRRELPLDIDIIVGGRNAAALSDADLAALAVSRLATMREFARRLAMPRLPSAA